MTIRTFWILLIKVLGIGLVLGSLSALPQFLLTLFNALAIHAKDDAVFAILGILMTLSLYTFVIWLFVFKATWLVDKLRLESGFAGDTIALRFTQQQIFALAIIVTGGLIIVDALPELIKNIFLIIRQENTFMQTEYYGWIIFYLVKGIIGWLLVVRSKSIGSWIAGKSGRTES